MGRHTHDSAGAIFEQYIIGDPDLHFFAIEGVDGVSAGEHAFFFHIRRGPVDFAQLANLGDKFPYGRLFRLAGDEFFHQRMFRRQHHIGHAKGRVRPRRINRNLFAQFRNVKTELGAFAATDPIFLHGADPFGPAAQQIQIF